MTMPSSNPVFGRGFANAASGRQQYPGAGAPGYGAPQYGAPSPYGAPPQDPYAAPSPYAPSTTQYMTMDDVVTKTGLSFVVMVATAALTWALPGFTGAALALPAVLIALVLGLVIAFKQIANPAATLTYGALYGIALGAISEAFNTIYPGIVMQALIGTFGVFGGMLLVYKTGAIRVTPKLTRWVIGALIGAVVLSLANMVAYFFMDDGLGLRDGSPLAILFSVVMIGIAAFLLLLDFDLADEAIRRGAPAKFAWYIAFGLLVTVVWLYIEILRLLSYFRE
jgi:uncharacterized YccA/Bax inhibitor family protein